MKKIFFCLVAFLMVLTGYRIVCAQDPTYTIYGDIKDSVYQNVILLGSCHNSEYGMMYAGDNDKLSGTPWKWRNSLGLRAERTASLNQTLTLVPVLGKSYTFKIRYPDYAYIRYEGNSTSGYYLVADNYAGEATEWKFEKQATSTENLDIYKIYAVDNEKAALRADGTNNKLAMNYMDNPLDGWCNWSEFLIFTKKPNNPPQITPIDDKKVYVGKEFVQFKVQATDDGELGPLTYSLGAGAPSGASIGTDGTFYWCPSEEQELGLYPVTIQVSDGEHTSTESFNVNVTEKYPVAFVDWDGTVLLFREVDYGASLSYGLIPTREGYTFTGWDTDTSYITSNLTVTAQYSVNRYTISFESNGGSGTSPITSDYGLLVEEPGTPMKTNYDFGGWYKDAELSDEWDFSTDTVPAENTTLYAKWTIKKYDVAFESNGGSVIDTISADYDSLVRAPVNPILPGYDFGGWYKDAGLSEKWDFSTDKVPANNIILYTKWSARADTPYKVEHYMQNITSDGYTLFETGDHTGTTDTTATAISCAYTGFRENTTHPNRAANGNISGDGSLILKLYYDRNGYTVTFKNHFGNNIKQETVRYMGSATAPEAPGLLGHTFIGWDNNFGSVTEDIAINARYTVDRYSVIFESNGGSIVPGRMAEYNSFITKPADPEKPGFKFDGWYRDPGLTTRWDFAIDRMPSPILFLYAGWTEIVEGTEPQETTRVIAIVNGIRMDAGKESIYLQGGKRKAIVRIDSGLMEGLMSGLSEDGSINEIEITVSAGNADSVSIHINADILAKMAEKGICISIKAGDIEYVIPVNELPATDSTAIEIAIERKSPELSDVLEGKVNAMGGRIICSPVTFKIKNSNTSGEETQVTRFGRYVKRIFRIPESADISNAITGVLCNPDGTFSHVPTEIFNIDGVYYAGINSLTNSSYAVIWNPVTVGSVENHWSKDAVNDMASRLVMKNTGMFTPDRDITRGEFAEFMTKALGIYGNIISDTQKFTDVGNSHEFATAITAASEYGIINGYPDGTFRPDAKISREEAMTMFARAMKIAGMEEESDDNMSRYNDLAEVSDWAYNNVEKTVKAGIFQGKTDTTINPKATFTCAEAITAIRNLLLKAGLIN